MAQLGTSIANAGGDRDDLSAIQGAIWKIEYGSATSGNAAGDALINSYVTYAQAHPEASDPNGFYPLGANGRGFGTTQGFSLGVPEPASWALMLTGFGMIGWAARRRRHRVTYA